MAKNNQTLGIIPARFASTRFPGKPLVEIGGKSMIHRVYEQAKKCRLLDEVVVATDDERIFSHVQSFGRVVMTSEFHSTGTDRCIEVASMPEFQKFEIVVNIQGDEPFIQPAQIEQVVSLFHEKENTQIGTLVKAVESQDDLSNSNVVKVVFGKEKKALYFSRSPIPFVRGHEMTEWLFKHTFYKHIGMYAFRRNALLAISELEKGELEKTESLEQLRWLEEGLSISIGITAFETKGIDTPEDLEKINEMLGHESGQNPS